MEDADCLLVCLLGEKIIISPPLPDAPTVLAQCRIEAGYLREMKAPSQARKMLSRLFAPVPVEVLRCVPRRYLAGKGSDGGGWEGVTLFF